MQQIVFIENGKPVCIVDNVQDMSIEKLTEIIEIEEELGRDYYYRYSPDGNDSFPN